jgi:hypothetical protein
LKVDDQGFVPSTGVGENGPAAPTGWSRTMRRWLAAIQPAEPALRMVASLDEGYRTVQIPLDEIRAVQLDDLAQVLDHRIARIMGSTSHVVRFIGGGELRHVYNSRGQVIELSSSGVRASVSPERVARFSAP